MARPPYPLRVRALEVRQPLGRFFVAVVPARVLLDVCYSHTASARLVPGGYVLDGNQRFTQDRRLHQIADYVARIDSSFPNALILAVDPPADEPGDVEGEQAEDGDGELALEPPVPSWAVERDDAEGWAITIPSPAKSVAVVDGQHRLFAFTQANAARHLDMPMICSIFFDLPIPFQAQLFATINSTQKRVDKSLTYEFFGYNVGEEPEATWTPEKLAVFMTRKLNVDEGSPLRGRVLVAPRKDPALADLTGGADWHVSTAVVVEGLLRLYSSNPRRDANRLLTSFRQQRSALATGLRDRSPMRRYYLETKDEVLYRTARNFLTACETSFWRDATPRSFITRTVGVQALFDVLRHIAPGILAGGSIRTATFEDRLRQATGIDFADDRFRSASGSGRTAIRREILRWIE